MSGSAGVPPRIRLQTAGKGPTAPYTVADMIQSVSSSLETVVSVSFPQLAVDVTGHPKRDLLAFCFQGPLDVDDVADTKCAELRIDCCRWRTDLTCGHIGHGSLSFLHSNGILIIYVVAF